MTNEKTEQGKIITDLPNGSIAEMIAKAEDESRRTGRRIRKVINKAAYLQEFPQASGDPRMALTPDDFILDLTPMEGMTVGQLRNLCLKKKGHPLALTKALQVEGYPDSTEIYILKEEAMFLASED